METRAIFLCFASQAGGGLGLELSNFIARRAKKFDPRRIIMPQHKSPFPFTHCGKCSKNKKVPSTESSIPWGFRLLKMPIKFQVFHHDTEKRKMYPSGHDACDPAAEPYVFQHRIRVVAWTRPWQKPWWASMQWGPVQPQQNVIALQKARVDRSGLSVITW